MKINSNISENVFLTLAKTRKQNQDYLFAIEQFLDTDALYKELSNKISAINYKIGKLKFENKPTDELEKEKLSLQVLLDNRLKELNLTKKDLSLKYNCTICKDIGIINGNYCSCFLKLYNKQFLQQLNITQTNLSTFNDNTLLKDNPLFEFIEKFKEYTKDFKNKSNYVFLGKCGVGKTFLAECIVSELKNRYDVLYLNSFELNNIFVKIHTAPLTEKNFYYSCILDNDLIVIDDFGTEPIYKNVTLEYLYLLFNERIKKNKPFILTTNLTPNEILKKYGERIFSRIFKKETITYEFPNQNLRK